MRKNKLYVPVMNSNVTEENRPIYVSKLKSIDADTVFIALDYHTLFSSDRTHELRQLADHIDYFRSAGFTVGVWIQAFGFGGLNTAEHEVAKKWTYIKSICGNVMQALCPEDPGFTRSYCEWVKDVAKCLPDMIMLDDDLCQSVRPGIGCICDRHKELYTDALEKQGLSPMPEDTALWIDKLLTGAGNPYRRIFFEVMGDSLRKFCRAVRIAVDEINPALRVGFCAGYTSWDIEGVDAAELSHILAGENTKPFLRLTGAPYWVTKDMHRFEGQRLNTVIEFTRQQEKWCRDDGGTIEIFSEADSYPRPRYHVPSSYVECFDFACHANGGMGTLKYVFDYYMSPDTENGYIKHHLRNWELYNLIDELFDGKQSRGVYVYEPMRKIADMTLPGKFAGEKQIMNSAFSAAASLLTAHAIPTTYDDQNADCAIVFGAAASAVNELPPKLILDLPAAKILTAAGIDVGLRGTKPAGVPHYERFSDLDQTGLNVPGHRFLQFQWTTLYESCILDEQAEVLSVFEAEHSVFPSAYRYTSENTEFYVLCVDTANLQPNCSIFLSYERQAQLLNFIGAVPHIKGHPGIYTLWKENDENGAVLFLNLCEDPLFDFEIELGHEYRKVHLTGADGIQNGSRIYIADSVAPYSAVVVEMIKC